MYFILIAFLFLFVLLLSLIVRNIRVIYNREPYRNFSETATPLIKNGFDMAWRDQVSLYEYERECTKILQRSYRRDFFFVSTYVVVKAKDAAIILGSSKHTDKSAIYDLLHPFLGTGLLTSNGEKWHLRRKMLTPAFHFNTLKEFCEIFKEESEKFVVYLEAQNEEKFKIIPVVTKFALNVICESAMGIKLSQLGDDGNLYRHNIYELGKLLVHRILRPWLGIDFLYSLLGHKKKIQKVLSSVHSFTRLIIKKRKEEFLKKKDVIKKEQLEEKENVYFRSKKKRVAMMDTLLQAQFDGAIDDEGIIEETDTFTFEGHDTTSSAIGFTLLLLGHHPEVQERIFEEISKVTSGTDDLKMEDLNKMVYMEQVIKESLRLYPPVHFISRALTENVQIDEVTYKKGTIVEIFINDIHRDPEYFPDPDKFDPDRFTPENCEKRFNFAFLAFSAGMRNCIGQRFAMMELKIMLTKIISNFKIVSVTKLEELTFIADLILRTKNPIEMRFMKR